MRSYRFYQVDVFTDTAFGGNPLAVFPQALGLITPEMQQLARELNLSETTFVTPAQDPAADFRVRIFTPHTEIPFAGHPLVGTHWVLAHLGLVKLTEPTTQVTFELAVGLRSATLQVAGGRVQHVVTAHQKPVFGPVASARQVQMLAQVLHLPAEAITDTGLPAQVVSTGLAQLFVPLRSLAEVQSIEAMRVDTALLGQVCEELGLDGPEVAVFCLETELPERDVHLRFFAPGYGIPEDPATGSASGGLGAYLVHHQAIRVTPPRTVIITEQGLEMGRPSQVVVEVAGSPEAIDMVWVSGQVVPVIEGEVHW